MQQIVNREFVKRAWIGEPNPFDLPKPPDWVLADMVAYDPDLVIMPGLSERCYRVQRYNPRARRLRPLAHDSELARAAKYGVMPVVSLLADCNWHSLLPWLRSHDLWRESSDAIADRLDAEDEAERRRIDAQVRDECEQRAVSSWFSFQVRTGQLVFVTGTPAEAETSVGQPSTPHRGPGQSGDLNDVTLPDQIGARHAGVALRIAEGQDADLSQDAVQLSGTASGEP